MHKIKAKETLEKLHSELISSEAKLENEAHTLLVGIANEIDDFLGDEPTEIRPGKERLEELAIKIETDHPRLAGILLELADILSKMGI